ncbi:transglycosylase SLT domain-containing protein [Methylorubrum extorquens]|uniref:Transglycosylase SLT domain-containing protein n=1 Tax=Methylorubrum extorquens TaxID=408 RepID=A0AAX3WB02_METEX|nr:transglycosylase SLT domain-containing protein [Methylorubrum extorquens]WHQ68589.1 transglycosylase SLT domain-containing protein [Methylorubrum extorquens]
MTISKPVGKNSVNLSKDVSQIQILLNRYRTRNEPLLRVDGLCGPKTVSAIVVFQATKLGNNRPDGIVDPGGPTLRALQSGQKHDPEPKPDSVSRSDRTPSIAKTGERQIAWGARVPSDFKAKVIEISADLDMSPDLLMSAMAFESGETFRPDIKNAAGSGAVGLIQFMPSTAKALGTDTDKLSKMTATDQLDYVKKYFEGQKKKLETIEDVYMAILYPAAVGKGRDHILFGKGKKAYDQNKGLDKNEDGKTTVGEAASKVRSKLQKGLRPGYFG